MEKESQTIFDKNVIEFVTVAAEFCAFLERAERMKRSDFVDTSLKISFHTGRTHLLLLQFPKSIGQNIQIITLMPV